MPYLVKGKATICIVNYRTLDFTRLALRCIRRFTGYPYEVIVVDNDSQDESLDYLRSLKWIRLIERDTKNDASGSHSHSMALELGYENCNTEFFVSMHSDAFVHRENWLGDLVDYFDGDERLACVGSGKLELTPRWRVWLKRATDWRTFKRKLLRTPDPTGKYRYYNRTICCLYRTAILRKEGLSFLTDQEKGLTSGEKLYFELVDRGYPTVELPPAVMGRYVMHVSHATQAVNIEEFTIKKRTVKKSERFAAKAMSSPAIRSVIADDSLDE
ncbi:MAG: glycosyltransferase [Sedimentisphaerales bacterium]|nr:glycosyltransferase [Sedimentisphaerales bacterium]